MNGGIEVEGKEKEYNKDRAYLTNNVSVNEKPADAV
jgi:hypothetical protein